MVQAQSRPFWSRETPGLCEMMITIVAAAESLCTLSFTFTSCLAGFGSILPSTYIKIFFLQSKLWNCTNGKSHKYLSQRTIILILNQSQGQISVLTTFYKFCRTILNIPCCPAHHTGEEDKLKRKILSKFFVAINIFCVFLIPTNWWIFSIRVMSLSFYGIGIHLRQILNAATP